MLKSNNQYGLSTLRMVMMRIPYFFTGVLFTIVAWSTLFEHWGAFEPIEGVAYAFWGAISVLAILGLRFPVTVLPLLLLQFFYKAIWLAAVGYPLLMRGELDDGAQELFRANLIGVAIDLIAIPWLYVFKAYIVGAFVLSDER